MGCAFRVPNMLGPGFLEKADENAIAYELREAGLAIARQMEMKVYCGSIPVGDHI